MEELDRAVKCGSEKPPEPQNLVLADRQDRQTYIRQLQDALEARRKIAAERLTKK